MVRRQPLVGDVRAERRRAGNAVPELHAGRVKAGVAGKRHRLLSHNADYIRRNRGTKILAKGDESLVKWYMPYAR